MVPSGDTSTSTVTNPIAEDSCPNASATSEQAACGRRCDSSSRYSQTLTISKSSGNLVCAVTRASFRKVAPSHKRHRGCPHWRHRKHPHFPQDMKRVQSFEQLPQRSSFTYVDMRCGEPMSDGLYSASVALKLNASMHSRPLALPALHTRSIAPRTPSVRRTLLRISLEICSGPAPVWIG